MVITEEKSHVGIDVSKSYLDVYILPAKKYMRFSNDKKGIKKLVSKMKSFSPALILMEATGGYERTVAQSLSAKEFPVGVINPRQIRDFAKALGKLAKTDLIDAETIALFAERIQPKANVVCDENQQQLSKYNARRQQLIKMITMEKNRLDKADKELKLSIRRIIKVLEKELEAVDKVLETLIKKDEEYSHKNTLLRSIKGVGFVIATSMIADLPELGLVSNKEIGALAGVVPYNRDSGTMRGKRSIWGGRASIRASLYMGTLSAIKHNVRIKEFYQRLCAAGKKKKVAITACMHKLIIIMNAMIKHDEPWRLAASS